MVRPAFAFRDGVMPECSVTAAVPSHLSRGVNDGADLEALCRTVAAELRHRIGLRPTAGAHVAHAGGDQTSAPQMQRFRVAEDETPARDDATGLVRDDRERLLQIADHALRERL